MFSPRFPIATLRPRVAAGPVTLARLASGCLRRWLTGLTSGGDALERLAWFGAGLSTASAAWLVGEVALGPLARQPDPPPRPTAAPVRVQVDGAVERPGVYDLMPGARVEDALQAAGGVADGGEPTGLNLVARVADGERIAVPLRAPPQASDPVPGGRTAPSAPPSPTPPAPSPRDRPRPTRAPPPGTRTPTPRPPTAARPPPKASLTAPSARATRAREPSEPGSATARRLGLRPAASTGVTRPPGPGDHRRRPFTRANLPRAGDYRVRASRARSPGAGEQSVKALAAAGVGDRGV